MDTAAVNERHVAWRRARVAVADADQPQLTVLDLEEGRVAGTLALPTKPVRLDVTRTGTHVVVVAADVVQYAYAGVSIVAHLDGVFADSPHIHISKSPPTLLGYAATGIGVAQTASNDPWLTAYFPGDVQTAGSGVAFPEPDLFQGGIPTPVEIVAEEAGAGVLVPVGDGLLASTHRGSGAGSVYDTTGAEVGAWEGCDQVDAYSVRGDVTNPARAVLACRDQLEALTSAEGILIVEPQPETGKSVFRVETFPTSDLIVTNQARRALIARQGGESRLLDHAEADICDFFIEPAWGEQVIALGSDGVLRALDLGTGELLRQTSVTDAFDCQAETRPQLALGPMLGLVSIPDRGEVLELNLVDLSLIATHEVGGRPTQLVVAGVDDRSRNVGTSGSNHN